jgi:pimeloyl-ACP methyl ester carboxylesterase
VLLLHAFPTASYDYARLAPLLSQRYRLILFDYPGFGFSDKPRRYPYSLLTYADALEVVARHFDITRTCVVAHDIGASMLLEVLRRGTLAVERLVLLNTSIVPQNRVIRSLDAARAILLNPVLGLLIGHLRLIRRPLIERMLRPLFARGLTAEELDDFWLLVRFNDGPRIHHHLAGYLAERDRYEQIWLETLVRYTGAMAPSRRSIDTQPGSKTLRTASSSVVTVIFTRTAGKRPSRSRARVTSGLRVCTTRRTR